MTGTAGADGFAGLASLPATVDDRAVTVAASAFPETVPASAVTVAASAFPATVVPRAVTADVSALFASAAFTVDVSAFPARSDDVGTPAGSLDAGSFPVTGSSTSPRTCAIATLPAL
jgi:hypothetical protein